MTRWIVIKKWEDFQAYKDRTVPWIKFYAELQHDEEWLQLPIGRRGMLASLWLEYMLSRCRLPADTRELTRRLRARVRQDDLEALNHAGFIELSSEPSPTHLRLVSDLARARATHEEEKRREKNRDEGAARSNSNGPDPSPYARHHGPSPKAAEKWIDNGAVLEVPDVALRRTIADEFKITDEHLLDELVDRAGQVKASLTQKDSS